MEKKCIGCDFILSEKSISDNCKKCRKKLTDQNYIKKNKEKISEYQKKYRTANREICNQRSKKSREKKLEYYLEKNKNHYREKHGIPLDDTFKKRKNGEGNLSQGYKTITSPDKNHPNNCSKGRIREHVYIMSCILNRPLKKGEIVHHKNGIRSDNRPENLELCHIGQPPGQRVEDKINYYIEFLQQYGYKIVKE